MLEIVDLKKIPQVPAEGNLKSQSRRSEVNPTQVVLRTVSGRGKFIAKKNNPRRTLDQGPEVPREQINNLSSIYSEVTHTLVLAKPHFYPLIRQAIPSSLLFPSHKNVFHYSFR